MCTCLYSVKYATVPSYVYWIAWYRGLAISDIKGYHHTYSYDRWIDEWEQYPQPLFGEYKMRAWYSLMTTERATATSAHNFIIMTDEPKMNRFHKNQHKTQHTVLVWLPENGENRNGFKYIIMHNNKWWGSGRTDLNEKPFIFDEKCNNFNEEFWWQQFTMADG